MKTYPNPFKKGDLLLIQPLDPEWYVDFNDNEAEGEEINNRPFFQMKEDAIDWCKEQNLDAFYETSRENEAGTTMFQLVEVLTGRVIYEHENGAILTDDGIRKALETVK